MKTVSIKIASKDGLVTFSKKYHYPADCDDNIVIQHTEEIIRQLNLEFNWEEEEKFLKEIGFGSYSDFHDQSI